MCGIASFLSNRQWTATPDTGWLETLDTEFKTIVAGNDILQAATPLGTLAEHFYDLMSFGLHMSLVANPETGSRLESIRDSIRQLRNAAAVKLEQGPRTDALESLREQLDDYLWQIDKEVLANKDRTLTIMPDALATDAEVRDRHFLAWGIEQVLESIDKLEVRGRDSAGIAVAFILPENKNPETALSCDQKTEFCDRCSIHNADTRQVLVRTLPDGRTACRFLYKVAQLVGQLGDNGAALREFIVKDELLWSMAEGLETLNIIAHTRWASNGIISVPNCHPVDGLVEGDVSTGLEKTMFVLNGDVDNYRTLVEETVVSKGAYIPPAISTDAKILPVLFHLDAPKDENAEERFRNVLKRCEGSLAVVMQNLNDFDSQFLAQKGSGQSFYIGKTQDGWLVASEAYGMAARARSSFPMAVHRQGGVSVILSDSDPADMVPQARFLHSGECVPLKEEKIEIFSRDIFRGKYNHYIEKEVHEASSSVRNTLHGKYLRQNGHVTFLPEGFGNGPALVNRFRNGKTPIARIICVGQGTAAVAAMAVASLLRRALKGSDISIEAYTGSELVGFMGDESMDNVFLIPVSQSGTTTDTNRVVDLCRDRGAWVNCIVNRRNSPLVQKSDSYIYTSNGRDVEMAVASTKAFYSQVAAGKLLSLWLADVLGTMDTATISADMDSLESLPNAIDKVLETKDAIGEVAKKYAPVHRYWALVGNGANCIAAQEVRIKLSELCYKSIPCDVTEDKKHIDLSTEPLTLVMASDLPEMVVMDTVKETTIFKAHNGSPIVFCAEDETRFDAVAEATIKVPRVGGGLDFVLETVAGHWWGIMAAKAIDAHAEPFRNARILIAEMVVDPSKWDRTAVLTQLNQCVDRIASGATDSALPARVASGLANYMLWLVNQSQDICVTEARLADILTVLNKAIEEMTRPIDTIRHQAKTVTVGISRPQG
ncbi:SIS domain-containing protein [Pseudodesulfovibrio piezophilus]|uniref:Glutamine--fructose-6-phosphate aminotransferase [isomerizing] n=1 Tax=Pseudodesulfovibrio piezophilus (strain DSM 21447 / JCM 15486 / C1TLV30) TaxID=1322246 RepID=M1WK00_PSEP2|nr:SIS domain-containing protein [Pseudodesulfovibrio piezophilus]CCH48751.1 Glutamine--fructose-6-phosphate transaminase (Isomerizing) [Pseudodesulfovibrio piezophilus C1TLV30]